MKKKISGRTLFIKLLLSAAFFWILISFVQANQLAKVLSRINWWYLALSFALVPVMLGISCLKWKMLLDLNEKKISFAKLFRIYLIGYFFSNLLPSTVGGDVARSYYSGKIIQNQSFSAIAIFIERFSGLFLMLFLVVLAPFLRGELYKTPYIYIPSICAFFLILITLWIWWVHEPLKWPDFIARRFFSFAHKAVLFSRVKSLGRIVKVIEKAYCFLFQKTEKLHKELEVAVTTIRKDKLLFAKITLATIVFYILTWINVYVCYLTFDVTPEFIGICALVPTVLFVAQVPVTLLGNLGFFESVFVFYFLLIGIPGEETLAMGLLLRIKMLSMGGAGYLMYLTYRQQVAWEDM